MYRPALFVSLGDKAAGVRSWPLTSIYCIVEFLYLPITFIYFFIRDQPLYEASPGCNAYVQLGSLELEKLQYWSHDEN
jgi:hypothetical protein